MRQELLAVSKKLVASAHDPNDLTDTYDYGTHALALREAKIATIRGDAAAARQKLLAARDGFRRILDANPQFLARSKNNLALALTELGELDTAEKKYDDAEANFRRAAAIRREVLEHPEANFDPLDDFQAAGMEEALATTLVQYAELESQRAHFDEADALCREAKGIIDKCLQADTKSDPRRYEKTRLRWARALVQTAGVAEGRARLQTDRQKQDALRQAASRIYETVTAQLQQDLREFPDSAPLRAALASYAGFYGRYLNDYLNDDRGVAYCELALQSRRWFWDSKDVAELASQLGDRYYELGVFALRAKRPELAERSFRQCLPLWELGVARLEAQGEPADSAAMIDKKTLRMLAQGRCGVYADTARMASELLRLAEQPGRTKDDRINYSIQSSVGFGMSAVAFPPGSRERADYFKQAMASLRQAVAFGWDNWGYLETDADFDPLRAFPEFQQAVNEWKKK